MHVQLEVRNGRSAGAAHDSARGPCEPSGGGQARRPLADRDAEGRRWPGSAIGRTAWVCRTLAVTIGAQAGRS